SVDRKKGGVEPTELATDSPPIAMHHRIAAMENPAASGRDDPRHLRITIAIGSGNGRCGKVPANLRPPEGARPFADARRGAVERRGLGRIGNWPRAARGRRDGLGVAMVGMTVRDEEEYITLGVMDGDDRVGEGLSPNFLVD